MITKNRWFRGAVAASAVLVGIMAWPKQAAAQDDEPLTIEPTTPIKQHRIGPFLASPSVLLRDVGVDGNVYNADEPTSDFTFTVVPAVSATARVLGNIVALRSTTELVYFAHETSERSVNQDLAASVRKAMRRLSILGAGSYINTRERPTQEIDARSRRHGYVGQAEVGMAWTPKFSTRVRALYSKEVFDGDAVFDNAFLAEELNRVARTLTGTVRFALTPLTAISSSVDVTRTRFLLDHVRDADARQVMVGIELQPRALISGSASLGYQQFDPLSATIPQFRGLVGFADVSFRLNRSTVFGLSGGRSIQYSYSELHPYYVRVGYGLSVRRTLLSRWNVQVAGNRFRHEYRRASSSLLLDAGPNQSDRLLDLALTMGFQASPALSFTGGVSYYDRQTTFTQRTYNNLRFGASVSYAF